MTRVLLPFPLQRPIADEMAPALGARLGRLNWRRFPDGESLVAVDEALSGADVAIVASLHRPDEISIAMRFAAATAREFGARSVGLVAPYLAYMRQDTRNRPERAGTDRRVVNAHHSRRNPLVLIERRKERRLSFNAHPP